MEKQYIFGTKAVGDPKVETPEHELLLIAGIGFGAFFTDLDEARIPRYAEAADWLGLTYQSIHAHCNVNPVWEKGFGGQRAIDLLISQVALCVKHGIANLVVHPSAGFDLPAPTEVGLQNFERLLDAARDLGVTVAFENLESDAHLDAVLCAFRDHPACGYCYDTGHALAYSDGRDLLGLYGEKLRLTHLHDNFGRRTEAYTSEDDLHLLPGDGKIDWKGVMDRIDALDYDAFGGILMSEVKYPTTRGFYTYDTYHAPSLVRFYTLVYERLERMTERTL